MEISIEGRTCLAGGGGGGGYGRDGGACPSVSVHVADPNT